MKVLLVNPNTVKSPPVIPIGLEYLSTALEKNGHEIKILDLTFSSSPLEDLENEIKQNFYSIIGFTIRNIDSALFYNNEFFLPEIKKMIQLVKNYKIITVLGGIGFSAMPYEILEFLDADYGIIGPGEIIFPKLLKLLETNQIKEKIYDGWKEGVDPDLIHYRGNRINYKEYFSKEGIIGFQTHAGCVNSCPYCTESKTKVSYRKVSHVVEEIKYLVKQGYNHFHLCDSEFNCNLKFSLDFCKMLIKENLEMKWTLYMTPTPYSEDLFENLKASKAYLITLTVASNVSIQKLNQYSYDDLKKIINYCSKYEIDLAIDLLVGYPNETIDSIKKCLDFFKENPPKTVGIGFYYRVYENTNLSKLIKEDAQLQLKLNKKYSHDLNFLEPIFYCDIKQEVIENLISNNKIFRIGGIIPGVNYQLV